MFKKIQFIYLVIVLVFLSGCVAFSSAHDGDSALSKAEYYFNTYGNHPVAHDNYLRAVRFYKRDSDNLGLAKAKFSAGMYFKTNRSDQLAAISYFEDSIQIFQSLDRDINIAMSQFGLANSYSILKNNLKACDLYSKSIESYKKGINENEEDEITVYSNETFLELVTKFKKEEKC